MSIQNGVNTFALLLCLLTLLMSSPGCSEKPSDTGGDPVTNDASVSEPSATAEQSNVTAEPEPVTLEPLPDPEGEEGGFSIPQVMQLAHENKLYRKLYKVPLDSEVAKRLTVLYEGLPAQSPPVGSPESWQKRSTALRDAAMAIINDSDANELDKTKLRALQKAVNCNNCHNQHTTDRAHSH